MQERTAPNTKQGDWSLIMSHKKACYTKHGNLQLGMFNTPKYFSKFPGIQERDTKCIHGTDNLPHLNVTLKCRFHKTNFVLK